MFQGFVRPTNNFSCSSWNYGSYCAFNPSYITQSHPKMVNNNNLSNQNKNIYNRYGKRVLRHDERIVTNEYLKGINYMKEMKKEELKRTKSANGIRKKTYRENNKVDNINNNNNEINNINNVNESNNNTNKKYHFQLTFEDWIEVKNKQKMIFNQIKKLKDLEDEKNEKLNMKIDKKYKEIKDKKYKEWLDKKNREFRRKKQEKIEEEIQKEEMKKETDALREEKMNEWFKQQAKKMEKEILQHQEEERIKKELERKKEEEKKKKKLDSKEKFREWKEKKDLEMKEKKREKMMEELEKKSKSKHSTNHWMNNKGFTIGPYTDAGALKEIQRFVAEKCTEDDNDEEGEEDFNNVNINNEEMARQMQINKYLDNEDDEQNQNLNVNNNINIKKEENNINNINNKLQNEEGEDD